MRIQLSWALSSAVGRVDEGRLMMTDSRQLAAHLRKLLKKQKRKANLKLGLKGVLAFLKTPLGVFFGICELLPFFSISFMTCLTLTDGHRWILDCRFRSRTRSLVDYPNGCIREDSVGGDMCPGPYG